MLIQDKILSPLEELFIGEAVVISKNSYIDVPTDFQFKSEFKTLNVDILDPILHSEQFILSKVISDKASAFRLKGISYIQIFHDELDKPLLIKSMICSRLGLSIGKFYARELDLKQVPIKDSKDFFSVNHLMGHKSGYTVGLYDKDILVCALTYKTCKDHIEIERFCTLLNSSCAGGFGKLVSYLKAFNKDITSFCDLRYSNGTSYEATGFVKLHDTPGWNWTDGTTRFNRLKCKATDLLTERQNAMQKGWFKIYDAGQRKYLLKQVLPVSSKVAV